MAALHACSVGCDMDALAYHLGHTNSGHLLFMKHCAI